jgi:hypothetical protein
MKKTIIRSINTELLFVLLFGLFFIGFSSYLIFVVYTNTDPSSYIFLAFGSFIIAINTKNAVKTIVFDKNKILIKSDLGFPVKIQLHYVFSYNEIEYASFGEIDSNKNSANQTVNSNRTPWNNLLLSRYSVTKCIVFTLRNGDKARLIINKFSKSQIAKIVEEILSRNIIVDNLKDEDTFINHHSNNINESFSSKKIKYPLILGIVTLIGMGFFFFYIYSVSINGGSAISAETASDFFDGYEQGNYYLSDHGEYTEVSYGIWLYMRSLEILMYISFGIMFIGNASFMLASQRKLAK